MYDGDTVITYEDKQALQAKVSYVKEKLGWCHGKGIFVLCRGCYYQIFI
ncbi:hypothetical protein BLGI_2895 [Brevibacillus laterosporus GI-9]|nr:hypothetical protein BLGI_2895 [Brevibacillus laterosporus GI-9]